MDEWEKYENPTNPCGHFESNETDAQGKKAPVGSTLDAFELSDTRDRAAGFKIVPVAPANATPADKPLKTILPLGKRRAFGRMGMPFLAARKRDRTDRVEKWEKHWPRLNDGFDRSRAELEKQKALQRSNAHPLAVQCAKGTISSGARLTEQQCEEPLGA